MNKTILVRFLLSSLGLLLFQSQSFAQDAGDSIAHIDCQGADTILAMTVSENAIIHYTTNRETGMYDNVTGKKISSGGTHESFFKDEQGNIWQLQYNSIAKTNRKGSIVAQYTIPSNYIASGIKMRNIAIDRKGNIWVASNIGLLVKTSSDWKLYNVANSALWSSNVYDIKVGRDNRKWIISDSGVNILGDTICANCNAWEKISGFPFNQTSSMTFDKDGNTIIGTCMGMIIRYNKNGVIDTLPICKKLGLNMIISAIDIDKLGNYWVGTYGQGLLKINQSGSSYRVYNSANSKIEYNYINAICSTNDSTVYVATSASGIYKIKPGNNKNSLGSVLVREPQTRSQFSNHISVFPNPSSGIFSVHADRSGVFDLNILDISGRTVKAIHNYSIGQNREIDLSDLSAGIYFLSLTSKTCTFSVKITIQK